MAAPAKYSKGPKMADPAPVHRTNTYTNPPSVHHDWVSSFDGFGNRVWFVTLYVEGRAVHTERVVANGL